MSVASRPALMPADTPDYMAPAWAGCVSWALGNRDMLAQFCADTGNNWMPSGRGSEMTERARAAPSSDDRAFMEAFVAWVNINVWGPMDGPDKEDGSAG